MAIGFLPPAASSSRPVAWCRQSLGSGRAPQCAWSRGPPGHPLGRSVGASEASGELQSHRELPAPVIAWPSGRTRCRPRCGVTVAGPRSADRGLLGTAGAAAARPRAGRPPAVQDGRSVGWHPQASPRSQSLGAGVTQVPGPLGVVPLGPQVWTNKKCCTLAWTAPLDSAATHCGKRYSVPHTGRGLKVPAAEIGVCSERGCIWGLRWPDSKTMARLRFSALCSERGAKMARLNTRWSDLRPGLVPKALVQYTPPMR